MTGQDALWAAGVLAFSSLSFLVLSITSRGNEAKWASILCGLATSLCAGLSFYLLIYALLDSGRPYTPLGVKHDAEGADRYLLHICYGAFIFGGLTSAANGLLRRR